MELRKEYVVGFLLDPTLSKVVLIRKINPSWQRGLLNGVGGKIEPKEGPLAAMEREFQEETGVKGVVWMYFLELFTPNAIIHFFHATGNVHEAMTVTPERIEVWDINDVINRSDTLPNIRWIIQMARTFHFGEHATHFEVYEHMVQEAHA